MTGHTLVLGIGNTLLGDEGAGIHALHAFHRASQLGDVLCVDGGTLSFSLLPQIEAAERLIVMDAAELNRAPGSVGIFEGGDMDVFLGNNRRRSVHEVGLIDLMAVALLIDALPRHRALIAIQPQQIAWSEHLSGTVAGALPLVCRSADALIQRWRDHAGTGIRHESA